MGIGKRVEGVQYLLIDARNWEQEKDRLISAIASGQDFGLDIETTNVNCHDGLKRIMKMSEDGQQGNKKLIFDLVRNIITGFSIFIPEENLGIYVNLNHADVENRIPWEEARQLIKAKRPYAEGKGRWRIHNAQFELAMFLATYNFDLGEDEFWCTLQLSVTVRNDDTYDPSDLAKLDLKPMLPLIREAMRVFAVYNPDKLTNDQEILIGKVAAKESKSAHSWNGIVASLNTRHGLKTLVKRAFNYDQVTYEEVLGDGHHMGALTGEEVLEYGVDDAYWCYRLFDWLIAFAISRGNQACLKAYVDTENPVVWDMAVNWVHGAKIDRKAVERYRTSEREKAAQVVREMKAALSELLPFPVMPHEKLEKYESWYMDGKHEKYRQKIIDFVNQPDVEDTYEQVCQIAGAISNAWAEEKGHAKPKGVNLVHYMPMRTIIYDLCGFGVRMYQGKIQSDGDTRDELLNFKARKLVEAAKLDLKDKELIAACGLPESCEAITEENYLKIPMVANNPVIRVLQCYKQLASLDQTSKLYLTPYTNMIDPDTGCMYPQMSTNKNTRRSGCSNPNGQQLAKYGGQAYVREFFEPDSDDEVLTSADWSSVELVIAGESSGDEEFVKAFSSLPFRDLHSVAAAGILEIPLEKFKELPNAKELRRDVGKGGNFGTIYAGNTSPVARQMGWDSDKMWETTEAYWKTFSGLKEWRDEQARFVRQNGYVELPDGCRRYRYEATNAWKLRMLALFEQFDSPAVMNWAREWTKRVSNRAVNQAINALIQGLCATLAKDTIIRLRYKVRDLQKEHEGFKARFWLLVHDELVFSVPKQHLAVFLPEFKKVMCNHPRYFKKCMLDSTLSIGLNFRGWDKDKCRHGQVELSELQKGLPIVPPEQWGKPLDMETQLQPLIDYLFEERRIYRETHEHG